MYPSFPYSRLRRNRINPWIRDILRENTLRSEDFILPIFICEDDAPRNISGMHDINRYSINEAIQVAANAYDSGIRAILLFPVIDNNKRSADASNAYCKDNLIVRAISAIKNEIRAIGIMTDVALDPYTIDGHDGITINGMVDNDRTVDVLCMQAISYARAGVDVIAPSDMMDGRVGAIRQALDRNGHHHVGITSYAAKFCSSLYAPFRSAVGISSCHSASIDKSSYQLDIANGDEAMREIAQDISEGADIIIIKPSLLYLDVIKEAKSAFNMPILGYIVSGEYAMLSHMANSHNNDKIMTEACICLKRAGASAIITYNAIDMAREASRSLQDAVTT